MENSRGFRLSSFCSCFGFFILALVAFWNGTVIGQDLSRIASDGQQKVVKVYGSGGFKSLEGYQSGCFVSAEGLVLTGWSYVLDPEAIRVVDHLGQKSEATLVAFDPETEIALLSTDFRPAKFFELGQTQRASVGHRVFALSNLFNVALGDEEVSVQSGIVSAVTTLDATQRALQVSYHGPVYYIDAMSNNPGSNGGALIDQEGRFIGMLGKELQESGGQFWINYAIPADVVAETIDRLQRGAGGKVAERSSETKPLEPMSLTGLGLTLIPRLTLNTPAYVEWIEPDSAAGKSGLRADDLILKVQGQLTPGRDQVIAAIDQLDRFSPVQMVIRRDTEILTITITP